MSERRFLVIVHEARDTGGYWAEVPELPGCVTQSDTLDELRRDIRTAIELYLEDEQPAYESSFAGTFEVSVA